MKIKDLPFFTYATLVTYVEVNFLQALFHSTTVSSISVVSVVFHSTTDSRHSSYTKDGFCFKSGFRCPTQKLALVLNWDSGRQCLQKSRFQSQIRITKIVRTPKFPLPVLGAEQNQFLCRVSFDAFSTEDEKTGFCSSSKQPNHQPKKKFLFSAS